jgi:hypothetical protein
VSKGVFYHLKSNFILYLEVILFYTSNGHGVKQDGGPWVYMANGEQGVLTGSEQQCIMSGKAGLWM